MGNVLIIKEADFSAVSVEKVTLIDKVKINVIVSPAGGGSVTGSGKYEVGETVSITATPSAGYSFAQWNDGNTNATRTITVRESSTYIAIFQAMSEIETVRDYFAQSDIIEKLGTTGNNITPRSTNNRAAMMISESKLPSDRVKKPTIDYTTYEPSDEVKALLATYSEIPITSGIQRLQFTVNTGFKIGVIRLKTDNTYFDSGWQDSVDLNMSTLDETTWVLIGFRASDDSTFDVADIRFTVTVS